MPTLSLLHGNPTVLLAPFYDLVSTDVYARRYGYQGPQDLTSDLALGIGGKTDPETIRQPDWQVFAAENRLGFRIVERTIAEVATASVAEAHRAAGPAVPGGLHRPYRGRTGAHDRAARLDALICRQAAWVCSPQR
jgi:hypothetical protein